MSEPGITHPTEENSPAYRERQLDFSTLTCNLEWDSLATLFAGSPPTYTVCKDPWQPIIHYTNNVRKYASQTTQKYQEKYIFIKYGIKNHKSNKSIGNVLFL